MNLGAVLIMLKLVGDIGILPTSIIGPPPPSTPNGEDKDPNVKPNCGPGKYAAKNPSGFWVCLDIPKGR